jgi:hypothetical protein
VIARRELGAARALPKAWHVAVWSSNRKGPPGDLYTSRPTMNMVRLRAESRARP